MQNIIKVSNATLIHGDCIDEIKKIKSESIGFTVFSPPFPELYTYSASPRDMGNCSSYSEFRDHFSFLPPELYRVTQQGRNVAIHCMDVPVQKGKHGYIGLKDFSGLIVELMEQAGFIYHSRITIWKNPVTEMQRTKALGLLHKQIKKDSTMSRVGIPDYVLVFRKDGERSNPVRCKINVDTWQQYASPVWQFDNWEKDMDMIIPLLSEDALTKIPEHIRQKYANQVWMDIDYGNTLNAAIAREDKDEKHICPLQLDTIHRLYTLYTNKGDKVLTTFMGIGSEVYEALLMGLIPTGIELKNTYYDIAVKNAKVAATKAATPSLFDALKEVG